MSKDEKAAKLYANMKPPKKAVKRDEIPLHAADRYEARETDGTDLAKAYIAWQVPELGGVMPVPPHRRKSA